MVSAECEQVLNMSLILRLSLNMLLNWVQDYS